MAFKIKPKGFEEVQTQLSFLSDKVTRMQHLFGELRAGMVELENSMNNVDFELIQEGENDARQSEVVDQKEAGTSSQAGGVQRGETSEHKEA
jgi:hypothetical protein